MASTTPHPVLTIDEMENSRSLIRVWVVRHAERADEAGRGVLASEECSIDEKLRAALFNPKVSRHKTLDPPLTCRGLDQATMAGSKLVAHGVCAPVIFCSAMLRTSQTAIKIATALNRVPDGGEGSGMTKIQRSYGLAACTSVPKQGFMSNEHISAISEGSAPLSSLLPLDEERMPFLMAMEHAVRRVRAEGKHDVVVVTHREGIRDMFQETGREGVILKPPYASITLFAALPPRPITVRADPRLKKYFMMLQLGIPKTEIVRKMVSNGEDPASLDDARRIVSRTRWCAVQDGFDLRFPKEKGILL